VKGKKKRNPRNPKLEIKIFTMADLITLPPSSALYAVVCFILENEKSTWRRLRNAEKDANKDDAALDVLRDEWCGWYNLTEVFHLDRDRS